MTWVQEQSSAASGEQLDLHDGGRWSAPVQAQPLIAHKLILRASAVVLCVLTLAGVGAAASFAQLPSAESLLGGELAFQASVGSAWLAPVPVVAQEQPATTATTAQAQTRVADDARPSHDESRAPGITTDGKVILNAADASELTRLPGVGQKRADAIVRLRQRLGRFKRMHDLLRVKGIGARSLRKIKSHAVLDAPKPDAGS